MKVKTSFVLLKKRVSSTVKYASIKAKSVFATVMHRIEVKRLLDSCPDEASRRLLKARIENQERELEIKYARIWNYQKQMTVGFLDMVEAMAIMYDDTGKKPTEAEVSEATELFENGKAMLLMYSRWMHQLNPGSCAKAWVEMIEPINLNSFKTCDEWLQFIDSLPVY